MIRLMSNSLHNATITDASNATESYKTSKRFTCGMLSNKYTHKISNNTANSMMFNHISHC